MEVGEKVLLNAFRVTSACSLCFIAYARRLRAELEIIWRRSSPVTSMMFVRWITGDSLRPIIGILSLSFFIGVLKSP